MERHVRERISTYDKMEHWGLVLIVTGVAAMTGKLVQWRIPQKGALSDTGDAIALFPVLAGVWGTVFLRIINFRYKEEAHRLSRVAKTPSPGRWGTLGLMMGYLPLLLGLGGAIIVLESAAGPFPWRTWVPWAVFGTVIALPWLVEVLYTREYRSRCRESNVNERRGDTPAAAN